MSSTPSLYSDPASTESALSARKACLVCQNPLRGRERRPMHQQICATCLDGMRTTKLEVLRERARARREVLAAATGTSPDAAGDSREPSTEAITRCTSSPMLESLAFGLVAAIAGCALYAGVEIVTHWRIGYVAVAVGYIVGWAMRQGSRGQGGTPYQIAAALLTYAAVAIAFIPVELYRGWMPLANSTMGSLGLFTGGFIEPLTELATSPITGVINLIIVAFGVRTAWRSMADKNFLK
jgi:hypothetical protein